MSLPVRLFAALAVGAALAAASTAAAQVREPSPYVPIENEPPPSLTVDPPLPGPLARGVVIVRYEVENLRIIPMVGAAALDVSPRVGHLHVSLDDLPWRWADGSPDETIIVQGLPPGEHKLLIELAAPDHRILTGQSVTFTVPDTGSHAH